MNENMKEPWKAAAALRPLTNATHLKPSIFIDFVIEISKNRLSHCVTRFQMERWLRHQLPTFNRIADSTKEPSPASVVGKPNRPPTTFSIYDLQSVTGTQIRHPMLPQLRQG